MKTTEFIVENSVIAQEADVMHADHEVQMARSQMYSAAQAAIEIHRLLKNISEMQGIEGWVASKLTLASEYLESVRDYLKYEQVSKEPEMMKFAEDAANYAVNQLLVEDDYDDAVKDYFSRGGKVEKLPAKKPRKSEKTDFSSRHISGKGEVGRGKAGRIGKAAKTDPKGKPVVATEQTPNLAGTGYQQGTSIVKTAPGQIQQDIGTSHAIGGTLKNIDSLRQGGPNTFVSTDPAVHNMIGGMKTAQTDVNKKLAIAGVGQTPTAPQQPAPKKDFSQYTDDDLSEDGETGLERDAAARRENERYDSARNYQGRNARGDVIRSGGEVVRGNPTPPSLIQRIAGKLNLPNTAKDALGDPMYKSSKPASGGGRGGGGGGISGHLSDPSAVKSLIPNFESKQSKKTVRENASAGASSAGGIATSMAGPAGKPGTGKPKKISNAHKAKKIAVGKGVY